MLTDQQKTRLEELQNKAGLDDKEWEELRKLDRLSERAAKGVGETGEAEDEGGESAAE